MSSEHPPMLSCGAWLTFPLPLGVNDLHMSSGCHHCHLYLLLLEIRVFGHSGTTLPRLSWKQAIIRVFVCFDDALFCL